MNTDEEPIAKRRRMTKERKARWLARQSQESLDIIRAVDAAAYRRRIEAGTPAQSQARRERYAEAHHLHNRLSDTYRRLREVESRVIAESNEAGEDDVNMVFRCDRHSNQRRCNVPTANEIAMAFLNSDGEPPFERNIRVYPMNPENPQQPFININILIPNLDPMAYPLSLWRTWLATQLAL
ncbi:hypothetical protein AVEN_213655-1 [Araneus ventricosus]|uniref:Helitron helicase-like domain-containing protein n=1 Tax=Araneus ventricosus TaxID=182803 RepID=A0A4Y2EUN5_ARAVE|nr:hypothetical protein AVEN_213655-1 [Araneus ventricosus]